MPTIRVALIHVYLCAHGIHKWLNRAHILVIDSRLKLRFFWLWAWLLLLWPIVERVPLLPPLSTLPHSPSRLRAHDHPSISNSRWPKHQKMRYDVTTQTHFSGWMAKANRGHEIVLSLPLPYCGGYDRWSCCQSSSHPIPLWRNGGNNLSFLTFKVEFSKTGNPPHFQNENRQIKFQQSSLQQELAREELITQFLSFSKSLSSAA